MADLKRFELNRPEYGIYMNELAFGGTAINTIGFLLRFPTIAPETLRAAVDRVIAAVPVFGLAFDEKAPCLIAMERREPCVIGTEMSPEEAVAAWEMLTESPMGGKTYAFCVGALTGGGSYLTARFHHIILDGYDMCKLVRRILDELAGTPTADAGTLTRYVPASPTRRRSGTSGSNISSTPTMSRRFFP